jgi:hypothetical protein
MARSGVVILAAGLNHVLGSDGRGWYDFWSGFGADIGELAFVGAAIGLYRKHNCHVHRCWRLAKQQVEGTTWQVCHRHHPDGKPTQADMDRIAAERRAAKRAASVTLPLPDRSSGDPS